MTALADKTVIFVTHQVEFLPAVDLILVWTALHILCNCCFGDSYSGISCTYFWSFFLLPIYICKLIDIGLVFRHLGYYDVCALFSSFPLSFIHFMFKSFWTFCLNLWRRSFSPSLSGKKQFFNL